MVFLPPNQKRNLIGGGTDEILIHEAANSVRICKTIDPAIYDFLMLLGRMDGFHPKFSCQGHRKAEPAWVRFEIKDNEKWRLFTEKVDELPFVKTDENTIYVYHRDKYPDLFLKLEELKTVLMGPKEKQNDPNRRTNKED